MIKAKLKLYLLLIKSAESPHINASRVFWEWEKLRIVFKVFTSLVCRVLFSKKKE